MTLTTTAERKDGGMTGAGDPFSDAAAEAWFTTLIGNGALKPPETVLVPAAGMAATAIVLARQGLRVKLVDASGDALREARALAKGAGTDFADVLKQSLLQLRPWHLGPVHHAIDHALLASLEPEQRFGYANRMGRIIPTGGYLAGIFRVGDREGGPPRAIPMADFRHLLFRYFVPEVLEPAGPTEPGADHAYRALLRRK